MKLKFGVKVDEMDRLIQMAKVRHMLDGLTIEIEYMNVYNEKFKFREELCFK